MKITQQHRREQLILQREALILAASFGRKLYRERKRLLKETINQLMKIPVNDWQQQAPLLLNEPYLFDLLEKMYIKVGEPIARKTVNEFMGFKSENVWERAIRKWISQNGGRKVTLINDSLKEWFRKELGTVLNTTQDGLRLGVEDMVELLKSKLNIEYPQILDYQVRRIVQTESLTSLSVAANESVKELGMNYTATWGITGNNTRPAHQAMDGVEADESGMFYPDGEQMEYPRDDRYGASAGNIINCSCFVIYSPK